MRGRRSHNRRKAVLPVRISGTDRNGRSFTELAHTLDVSSEGAKIGGVTTQLNVGDVIEVQYRHRRAPFRIIWIQRPSARTSNVQLGIVSVRPAKDIWELGDVDNAKPDNMTQVPVAPTQPSPSQRMERHAHVRHKVTAAVAEVRHFTGASLFWGPVTNISLGSCYLETLYPLPQGANVRLVLTINRIFVRLSATVTTSHPNVGMGLAFAEPVPPEWKTVIRAIETGEELIGSVQSTADHLNRRTSVLTVQRDLIRADQMLRDNSESLDDTRLKEALKFIERARLAIQAFLQPSGRLDALEDSSASPQSCD